MSKYELYSKTFMYLAIGLLITFITGFGVSLNSTMLYNVVVGKSYILIWILQFVLALFFSFRLAKMSKMEAVICYALYSFLTGLTFASLFALFSISSIIIVFLLAACIFGILAFIGITTKKDVTSIGTILFVGLIAIIIVSLINIFLGSGLLAIFISIVSIMIFLGYTVYDVKRLSILSMVNEEAAPIYGAFELYLDFINLFINLLELFARNNNN